MPKGILNKASLVMVPEAPIDGTMPSVFPEDRSGDFTFTRGSNLSATRVASNGLIEKGRENTLLYSNDITNPAWLKSAMDITTGHTSYNGSANAFKLIPNNTSTFHRIIQSQSWSYDVRTASFYAKADGYNIVRIVTFTGATDISLAVNLSDGSIIQESGSTKVATNVQPVGNDWYRISLTAVGSATTSIYAIQIYVYEDPSLPFNWSGDGSSGVLFADPQRELGLVATNYIESGATTGKAGLLENEPRIDFTGGGCGALLLEPQRSNLITQSEYFGSADWSKQNSITVNTNSHLSPEGIQNATKLDGFDSSNFQSVSQYITLSDSTYTFSVFLKKTTGALTHYPAVVMGSIYKYVIINSTTGTYAEATGTNDNNSVIIESWDDNWWRVSLTNTLSAGAQRFAIYPSLSADGTSISTNASGANVFFGAQVEQGGYPTSYIPTYGSAVTRSVDDTATLDLSTLGLNGEDVTYFIEFKNNQDVTRDNGGTSFRFSSNNSNTGSLRVYRSGSSLKQLTVVFQDSNNAFSNPGSYEITSPNPKVAIKRVWATGEIKVFVDGIKVLEGTSTLFNSWNKIDMEGTGSTIEVKQLLAFPTALTDEECSALTQP